MSDERREKRSFFSLERVNGAAIFDRMRAQHMTSVALSDMSGVSRTSISNYITGKVLLAEPKQIRKLAGALGCDIIDLILVEGEQSSVYRMEPSEKCGDGGLMGKKKPEFKTGASYLIKAGRHARDKSPFNSSYCKYIGRQKGAGCVHYLFKSIKGGYVVSFTEREFLLHEVKAELLSTREAERLAA